MSGKNTEFPTKAGSERKQAMADGTLALLSGLYSLDADAQQLMRKFWFEFDSWRSPDGAYLSGVPGNWDPETRNWDRKTWDCEPKTRKLRSENRKLRPENGNWDPKTGN